MGSSTQFRHFLIRLRQAAARSSWLLIPLAALVASSPRFLRGVSCGHDFEFHLNSWFEAQRAWSQGILYPHWAQSPNWEAGEPRFVFYPPLTWMLGALLGFCMKWEYVPAVMTFLFLASAGLTTRALARRFLPGTNATLAGVIATATPYALFTAYERTAFAELAAAAFIPLLLLYALLPSSETTAHEDPNDPATRPVPYRIVALALILAAIWLTNAPAGVMASYLLAFAALAAAILQRSWKPIARAAIAAPIGIGMAAFFLVPAAWEQRWIAIQQALDVGMRVTDSWLFARHAGPDLELHDQVLRVASSILLFTVLAAVEGVFIGLKRRRLTPAGRHFWLPLALLLPALLLLQFPVSALFWKLPKLEFLQFPWRWLMVLGTPFAVFLAAATPLASRRARIWSATVWSILLLALAGIATLFFFQNCDDEDAIINQVAIFQAAAGVEGTDEYAPLGSDNTLVASGLPDGCLVSDPLQDLGESSTGSEPVWFPEQGSCDDTFTADLWQSEHKILPIESDQAGYVVLRLRRYPAWSIHVDGRPVALAAQREDGLMVIPVPAGVSTIELRWATTPDVLWGRWISLCSIGLLLLVGWGEHRAHRGQAAAFRLS